VATTVSDDQLAYRVPEAAKRIDIGLTKMWEMVNDGTVKVVRFGGRVVVPRSELERVLAERLSA
jgi:excisionase family DNA binding protein